jgi:hypothetical protein
MSVRNEIALCTVLVTTFHEYAPLHTDHYSSSYVPNRENVYIYEDCFLFTFTLMMMYNGEIVLV